MQSQGTYLVPLISIEFHRNDNHTHDQHTSTSKYTIKTPCDATQSTLYKSSSIFLNSSKMKERQIHSRESRKPSPFNKSIICLVVEHLLKIPLKMRSQVQSK